MKMRKFFLLGTFFCFLGCGHTHYVFQDLPPVESLQDQQPSPLPEKDPDFEIREYLIASSVRHPLVEALDTKRTPRSQDVNSLDQVPKSTWYTPRLGYEEIQPNRLLKGPEQVGSPQKPLTVLKLKKSGTAPGFIVKDARGEKYLVKFDLHEHAGLASSANFVMSRLFWGLGYNVPDDYILTFRYDDLKVDSSSEITNLDLDELLLDAIQDSQSRYRGSASLFIEGEILGHVSQKGTRKDDLNDWIPHENRRVLRALSVFCAWVQHTGMRSDNTLEAYVGNPGQGYTLHYLLDFDEALGVHGLGYNRRWDGAQHYFSWRETFENAVRLGISVKPWENNGGKEDDPKIYFEATTFDPAEWKEVYQFLPMGRALPDDRYWASKIIASVTKEHLRVLFDSAEYADASYVDYLLETLLARRKKILNHTFSQVSPVESTGVRNGGLQMKDVGKQYLENVGETKYQVRFFNQKNQEIGELLLIDTQEKEFSIPMSKILTEARPGESIRVEVLVFRDGKPVPRPAEFHIYVNEKTSRLVGVVH